MIADEAYGEVLARPADHAIGGAPDLGIALAPLPDHPEPPQDGPELGKRLRIWLDAHVDRAALLAAARVFVLSRLLLLTVTYLALAFHPYVWGRTHPGSPTLWDAWYQWDARWYVRLARSGYHWYGFDHWSSVAFFPFYPLLILAAVTIVPVSTKLVAMIVSNALFFVALYFLHRLVRWEFGEAVAHRTLFYLALFPTALFFFAGYSESPFLCWTVLCMTALRRRQWARAALWGGIAAITRSQGLVLMLPFAYECWHAHGGDLRRMACLLWGALIPIGWGFLALYMQVQFDDPFLFVQSQSAWHRITTWPWVGIWESLQRISPAHIASNTSAHNLIELCGVCLFVGLIWAGWRVLPRVYSLYASASLCLILVNPAVGNNYYLPLMSTSRLCLALFPCFIALAIYGERETVDRAFTTFGPALLALFTVVFLQGAWVA
jgi:mannosyltransferase PIG-V